MNKLIAIFIALSLCVSWFYLTREQAFGSPKCQYNPNVFAARVNGYWDNPAFQEIWKPRVVSMILSGWLVKTENPRTLEEFANVFGFWQALWLGATFAVVIILIREPTYILFAVSAGLAYSFTVDLSQVNILPWEAPTMFFFTAAFLFWWRGWNWPAVVIIIAGFAIKETVAVASVFLLFTATSWSKRLIWFGVTGFGCLIIHYIIACLFPSHTSLPGICLEGIKKFYGIEFSLHWNNALWIGGGLIMATLMAWPLNRKECGVIAVLSFFGAGLVAINLMDWQKGGHIEVRQWSDVLPMCAVYLQTKLKA